MFRLWVHFVLLVSDISDFVLFCYSFVLLLGECFGPGFVFLLFSFLNVI